MTLTPILKKMSSKVTSKSATPKQVAFCSNVVVKSLITSFKHTGSDVAFNKEFSEVRQSLNRKDLLQWLQQMTECVPLLDRNADILVLEFLKVPWFEQPSDILDAFHNFIVCLVSAHNYYNYTAIGILIKHLVPQVNQYDNDRLTKDAGCLTEEQAEMYSKVLNMIVAIHNCVPMSRNNIIKIARKSRPYFRHHAHLHCVYTRNLLVLGARLPNLRVELLEVIITNMLTLDVHAPRQDIQACYEDDDAEEEVFEMDMDQSFKSLCNISTEGNIVAKYGHTLDVLMVIMLQYIHSVAHGLVELPLLMQQSEEQSYDSLKCRFGVTKSSDLKQPDSKILNGCECGGDNHNLLMLKQLYDHLKQVFNNIILPTRGSSHIQFLLFYLIALRPGLLTKFLEYLLDDNFKSVNCVRGIRYNAMAYIASLLARGTFVPISHVHSCLEMVCDWCHSYLDNQEKYKSNCYGDLVKHAPFYYACQAVFYVFTFRYAEYTENSQRLSLSRSLNMERLVLSALNPLQVCSSAVVTNFASVTRHYQLAYCYTILENNKRLTIPVASNNSDIGRQTKSTLLLYFPFDPYLLKRSKKYIVSYYKEFEGIPENKSDHKTESMDVDDDFLSTSATMTPKVTDFSYEMTSGYRRQ